MDNKFIETERIWNEFCKKEKLGLKNDGTFVAPEPNFRFLITTLSLQASIMLGRIPNPATDKFEENLTQAKLIIDTLGLLKDKTKGNLSQEEGEHLDTILMELRALYMEPRHTEP